MPAYVANTPVSPVPTARADDLSDAVAKQMALDKLIAQEKKQLASITAQQATLQGRMATTQANLDQVNQSIDELQSEIDSLATQVSQVHATYDGLVADDQQLQQQLVGLDAEAQTKARELQARQAMLAQRLIQAYEADQTPLLTQILTSGSLTDALSQVNYYLTLAAQDQALAEQIKQDQSDLTQLRQATETARANVQQIELQVGEQKTVLDKQMAELTDVQSKLALLKKQVNAELAKQQAANAKLAKNKAALAAAIRSNGAASARLAQQINGLIRRYGGKGRIPSVYNGSFQWPMGGSISQEFGCTGWPGEPRVGNCAHFHQGIDIVATCLTPVHAAGSGVVLFVGYNPYDPPPRAWIVIIAHSSSLVTWYAHMTGKAPPGIYAGAQVYMGQVIGTENTTGHSTGCHLHWAVRVNGVFMNPRLFL